MQITKTTDDAELGKIWNAAYKSSWDTQFEALSEDDKNDVLVSMSRAGVGYRLAKIASEAADAEAMKHDGRTEAAE